MIGHLPLIAMRRNRRVPVAVFFNDFDCRFRNDWHTEPSHEAGGYLADVEVEGSDVPELLDLRFAVGLQAIVLCDRGLERAQRLHRALIAAMARDVVTNHRGQLFIHIGAKNG